MADRPDVDYAIAGAGLAGLLLARKLLAGGPNASKRSARVFLADPRSALDSPATFAFWTRSATELDPWLVGEWDAWNVVDHGGRALTIPLGDWTYRAISWDRARAELLAELRGDPRVVFVPEPVTSIVDDGDVVRVVAGSEQLTASWAFDSRSRQTGDARVEPRGSAEAVPMRLSQSFSGIWVETATDAFDQQSATLLDFSTDSGSAFGFSYVLPTRPTLAMVMAVRVASDEEAPDPRPAIDRLVGRAGWRPVGEERGVTRLMSPPIARRQGRRTLAIGCRGGRARPSTGYAVTRILRDSAAIASSLERLGHPFDIPSDPNWQIRLDTIWMRALAREGSSMDAAFVALFEKVPIGTLLRFLDGDATRRDALRVATSLPPGPFLRAMVNSADV